MLDVLDKNFFELFGLPESFELDINTVKERYRDLQKQLHPDRYANAAESERRLSVQITARINEAFQALKNPLSRGRYLLQLRGIDTHAETDTAMDPAFLNEQIELREALESARQSEQSLSQLNDISQSVDRSKRMRIEYLKACFSRCDDGDLSAARNTLRELQFLEKITNDILQLEDDLT